MTFERILTILLGLFFLFVICFLGLNNKDFFVESVNAAFEDVNIEELQSKLSSIETTMKENFSHKNQSADIYGLGLMAMNKKAVGNNECIKLKSGKTIGVFGYTNIDEYYDNIIKLNDVLKAKNIPLIYMDIPYYDATKEEAAASGYSTWRRLLTEIYTNVQTAGIDTMNPNEEISDIPPYFETDGHYRTEYDFQIARNICNKLMNQYNMDMPEYAKVFDLDNYDIKNYPFIGATARNSGRYFSGIDDFQIFHPRFETSMELFI